MEEPQTVGHPIFRVGGVSYLRIPAPEPQLSASFYRSTFGWEVQTDRENPSFEDGTGHVIGHFMSDLPVAGEGGVVPYIFVESVDDTLRVVAAEGGAVVAQPYPEGDLWVATFRDPPGNLIGVWQLGPRGRMLEPNDRSDALSLLDWRRRTAALYEGIRSASRPADAHHLWQQVRNAMFATHPSSPLLLAERGDFTGLPVAPYDARLRFTLPLDTDVAPTRIEMPASGGASVPFERAGTLHVPAVGDLDVWWLSAYSGGIFVPIKDSGAGTTTYGGGRYLLDTAKGADLGGDGGHLVIDLNFAYNPSCAYDPVWVCPLAPPGNTVPAAVLAGELLA